MHRALVFNLLSFPFPCSSPMVHIDSRVTMHVLVPKTTHATSVWDAFTHCYKATPIGVLVSSYGVVVILPSAFARCLHRVARNERPTRENPLFIIPDAGVEEMSMHGFDYRYNSGHPMQFIGVRHTVVVQPAAAPSKVSEDASATAGSSCAASDADSERARRKRAATKIALFFAIAGNRAKRRELRAASDALATMTRRENQLALRIQAAFDKIKTMEKDRLTLKDKIHTTEKDRDQLVSTMQNVINERDKARSDAALWRERAQNIKAVPAIPVAPAAPAIPDDGEADAKAKEHKEAYIALNKFSRYKSIAQLLSFCDKHNKTIKTEIMSVMNENKKVWKQCNRMEKEHADRLKSLQSNLKGMKVQVEEAKRFEVMRRICRKLIDMTGAKDPKHLETILAPLYEVAQEFKDFGGRPPLAGFILWAKTISDYIGTGKSQHWKVPKLFALYNELTKFNEGHNTVDAMHVLNVAVEQKGLTSLSAASVRLAKPSLVVDVGSYDRGMANKPLPKSETIWTKEYSAQLYQFCLHHTCDFTGNSSLLEIVLSLQDSQPPNISKAASEIHIVFANVVKSFTAPEEFMEGYTPEHFLHSVFLKCQARWQHRPFLMKCNSAACAVIASRALCLRSCFQVAGVEVRDCKTTPPLLVRIASQFPEYSREDYELLVENEGEHLAAKHMFTVAAIKEPLKNAAFPWCTKHVYMMMQQTHLLWDIVTSSENFQDARRILMRIIGTGYVTDEQIQRFRHESARLRSFKILYRPEDTTSKHNRIAMTKDLEIKVSGSFWERSVAEQMGCDYPDIHTTDDEYWNFIYQWVGKHMCDFCSDWHLSVAPGVNLEETASVKTPPASPKRPLTPGPRTPAEHFMQTVEKGLQRAKENGSMSRKDIAELQATANSLNAKIQFIDLKGSYNV